MEQMDINHIEYGAIDFPSCAQKSFAWPFALGKKVLWKFSFFFGGDRFNIAGMYRFSLSTVPFMREEIPNFYTAYRLFDEVQVAKCLWSRIIQNRGKIRYTW